MNYILYIIKKYRKGALFITTLFVLFYNFTYAQILSNVDSKCLWVNKDDIYDTLAVDSVFDFAIKNNINKLFIESISNGEAAYESDLIYKDEMIDSIFDPLNYFLYKSEFEDIEIHACMNAYLLWSKSTLPSDETHFYYNCNDCFESDFNGKSDGEINLYLNQSKNWEGVYISPMHPVVNKYLLSVIEELFENYNIDGLVLDYIRFQDSFYGYNKFGIDVFSDKYNIDPRDIDRGIISTRFGYSEEFIDSINNSWDNFRTDKVTELVRSIKYRILNDTLDIEFSVFVKPNYKMAKERWHQDWMSWINEDIIDFAIIKNYYNNFSEFNYINKVLSNELTDYIQKNKIIIGINSSNDNPISISNKILLSRLQGYEHFSIYSYDIDKDTLNWYSPIFKSINFDLN